MGFLSYGSAKGLSVQHDFQKDIDRLYKRESYRSQINAQKEQKTKYYAELMKEHDAESPWIRAKLEEEYKKLNGEIADFAIENPNFETDVNKMSEFLSKTDKYLNNDLVRMDKQSKDQYAKMTETFNNGEIDEDQWLEESEKYDNWMRNGTEAGQEYASGYIFNGNKLPSYKEILMAGNEALQGVSAIERNGNMMNIVEKTPQERISTRALWDLQDPQYGKVIQRNFEKFNEQNKGFYKNALDYHMANLSIGEEEKITSMTWDPSYKAKIESQAKQQEEMVKTSPAWARNIASQWNEGAVIAYHKGMEVFTPAGKIGAPMYFNKGTAVKYQLEGGDFKEANLSGTFVMKGIEEMKIMPDGSYMKVNVETRINEQDVAQAALYKVTIDGVDKTMTSAQFAQWKSTLNGLSDEELQIINNADGTQKIIARDPNNSGRIDAITVTQIDQKSTWGQQYQNAGFNATGTYSPNMISIGGESAKFPVYEGSIWIKANINPETLQSYEAEWGGQAKTNLQVEYGTNQSTQVIARSFADGNYEFGLNFMNQEYGDGWKLYEANSSLVVNDKGGPFMLDGKSYKKRIYNTQTGEYFYSN